MNQWTQLLFYWFCFKMKFLTEILWFITSNFLVSMMTFLTLKSPTPGSKFLLNWLNNLKFFPIKTEFFT